MTCHHMLKWIQWLDVSDWSRRPIKCYAQNMENNAPLLHLVWNIFLALLLSVFNLLFAYDPFVPLALLSTHLKRQNIIYFLWILRYVWPVIKYLLPLSVKSGRRKPPNGTIMKYRKPLQYEREQMSTFGTQCINMTLHQSGITANDIL